MKDAYPYCEQGSSDLLVVNVDRTDEASWLRAGQLHLRHPEIELWVVTSWSSTVDRTLANFVRASQVIYYRDLWRLADEIRSRIGTKQAFQHTSREVPGPDVSSPRAA
jgi:hypothetical protein